MRKVYNAPLTEEFKMDTVGSLCSGSPMTKISFDNSGDGEDILFD